jgi:hypothetical protein
VAISAAAVGVGRAAVGDEVDQGGVGLVADGRDQRDRSLGHRARQALVVEGPQVLDRAAAAGDDDDVGTRHGPARRDGVEAPDRGADLAGGGVALDHAGPDQHPAGPAVADAVQDVADHRAGRTGDHPDHGWHGRQRALAVGREQALGVQLRLQALQLGEKRADPGGLHGLDDDLVARAGRIGGDLAGDDDLQPMLGPDLQLADIALPDHAVDRRLVVLDGQIDVAVGMVGDLRQLAAQPHEAVAVFQRALQGEGQFRDGIGRALESGATVSVMGF